MRKLTLWLPAILMGTVIFLSSQLFDVPRYTPMFEFFAHVKTVAHVVLYFGLGLVLARLLAGTLQIGAAGILVLTSALCVAYGASDEFHQMFVPGRTANFFDIVRDLVGGTLGALFYLVCAWMSRSTKAAATQASGGIGPMFAQTLVTVAVTLLITVPTLVFSDSIVPFIRALASAGQPTQNSRSVTSTGYALTAAISGTNAAQKAAPQAPAANPAVSGSRNNVTAAADDISRNGDRTGMGSMVASAVDSVLKGASNAGKDAQQALERISGKAPAASPEPAQKTKEAVQTDFRPDLLAVVVNPANPVSSLTTDQVRKIFCGEYTNWNQVGGPDLPVTVLIVHPGLRNPGHHPENLLKASPAPNAVTLRYASFIFPRIDRVKGAVAFVPISVKAQLGFMEKHEAIKLLALSPGNQAPAVLPSRMAINLGSYPIVVDQPRSAGESGNQTRLSLAR
jgi:VanZ family protein